MGITFRSNGKRGAFGQTETDLLATLGAMSRRVSASESSSETALQVISVTHRFGPVLALDGVSLTVLPGEFVSLLGPSGSGKTTLLRIIAGLAQPTTGTIRIAHRDVTRVPTQARGIGFVFQSYALFPHLSVFENIAYPLRIRRVRGAELSRRVAALLAKVNLSGLGERFPAALSGGQQQRVAVARALVYEPSLLLMDEPLGALDRKLRLHMQRELRRLQQDLGITCIYVTHDQEEALTMSDRVAVMHHGRILQVDVPIDLYQRPVERFVADFIGSTNFLRCVVLGRQSGRYLLHTRGGVELSASGAALFPVGSSVDLAIRAERIALRSERSPDAAIPAKVSLVTFAGNATELTCVLAGGEEVAVQVPLPIPRLGAGADVWIGWSPTDAALFASEGSGYGLSQTEHSIASGRANFDQGEERHATG